MFNIGERYKDREGNEWLCVKPLFGSLPEFERDGKRVARSRDGKYRFDGEDSPADILANK